MMEIPIPGKTVFILSWGPGFSWNVMSYLPSKEFARHLGAAHAQRWQWIHNSTLVLHFNSLRPSEATWRHRTRSTLVQVMACCLTTTLPEPTLTNHQWGSVEFSFRQFYWSSRYQPLKFLKITLKIIKITSRRGRWVNAPDRTIED